MPRIEKIFHNEATHCADELLETGKERIALIVISPHGAPEYNHCGYLPDLRKLFTTVELTCMVWNVDIIDKIADRHFRV